MKQGLSKADTIQILQHIDLVGMTLTSHQVTGDEIPSNIMESLIVLLGSMRASIQNSYGLNISPAESLFGTPSHNLTASELADQICSDLEKMDYNE